MSRYALPYSKRTLQRRLNHLVEVGLLTSEGQGRGRRYRSAEHHPVTVNETNNSGYGDWRSPEYAAVRQSLGAPDPFRLRHRTPMRRFVREIILKKMDKRTATRWVAMEAKKEIPQPEQARFIEVVETELFCLHEGNIVRYRLRPAEFTSWKSAWH